MTTNISKKYKKLTPIDHILLRPARYLGTAQVVPTMTLNMDADGLLKNEVVDFNPAFLKMFDEIITNSCDHSRTKEGAHLNEIHVGINKMLGTISVFDNGGIPVVKHDEHGCYIPELIFGHLHAGSNFNENDEDGEFINTSGAGMNGEGSKLVNIFSTYFRIITADGKHKYEQTFKGNMKERSEPKITKCKDKFTEITWIPDYQRLGMVGLDDTHKTLIERRTIEIATSCPSINVKLLGRDVDGSFSKFLNRFNVNHIIDDQYRWRVAVMKSEGQFDQTTYVNTTNTYKGGTHVDHIMNNIVSEIRDHIKKKTKQDIRPADIKSHFHLVADCTIDLPRYNSQTKEDLITPVSQFGTRYTPSPAFIKKVIKSDIVESIIEWALRKQQSDEDKEAKKLEKENAKANLNNIIKYEPAISKNSADWMLLITEGDSAAKPLQSARQEHHGIYPLKGKPMNVHGETKATLLKNEEFSDLIRILDLSIADPSVDNIRYGRGICICTDADLDGIHIRGLIFNIFGKFWRDAFAAGLIHVLNTPVAIVEQKKKQIEFFNQEDLEAWIAKQPTKNFNVRYLKGLGSNNSVDFKRYLSDDKYIQTVEALSDEDLEALDLVFNKDRADDRKEWLDQ